uniref:Zf-CCHC domain-containing protein/DUF4219 domain-containing protein/UBN2 domain-containing protein n=1 Tax=Tanacetum cinerariifolium TaxID=118510 RepID=A0A699HKK6_TANCI|nr:zf-CCHC domain-containing protein/DUF4219 domain-containing protein/UBN2 domain-containing protein [Tanacetum cinerariifolium]GEY36335.1 zf-CCHC domain-containing protein/DUF4219 domain-containing protein/UBN2 domain-containing protein [Tanacetum cinerariifolium]
MAQEKYVKGCFMQRPPLLEPNGFCFLKARFETYVKSKDIDLWQVIQNSDFYYEVKESETKLMTEMPYELLEDDQKKKLNKNNEAKMTLYNALPCKEYKRAFMCKTAKEVWHTVIITHQGIHNILKDFRGYTRDLDSIWEETGQDCSFTRSGFKDTRTVPEDSDSVKSYVTALERSKTTKEKVKSLSLKANATREQASDDTDSQGGSDKDIDEEEAEEFNLLDRNFRKGNRFERKNQFGSGGNRFGRGRGNSFEDKGGESSKKMKLAIITR